MRRLVLFLGLIIVAACTTSERTPIETDSPTTTPNPTATIIWFPPTNTPQLAATMLPSPTLDLRPGQGEIIFRDDFDEEGIWSLVSGSAGSIALLNDRLILALSQPNTFLFITRTAPILGDFYLEITANVSLCRGADEYGLLVRVTAELEYYRISLSCDGRARVDRYFNGKVSSVVPWMANGVIPTTVPSSVRFGVWARAEEIRFFVNDQFLFSLRDTILYAGTLGAFVRTAGETPVTVSFSELVVKGLGE